MTAALARDAPPTRSAALPGTRAAARGAARAGALLVAGALAALAAPSAAAAQGTPAQEASTIVTLAGDEAIDRLIAVLSDDAARAALIAGLEDARAAAASGAEGSSDPATVAAPGLAQRLAAGAAGAGADLVADARRAWAELARLRTLGERLDAAPAARGAAAALAATILSTIAASLAFEGLAGRLARRLRRPVGAGWAARAGAAALALGVRLAAVALAWAVGQALASLAFAEGGRPAPAQTLYLNAFAAFGLARIALRAFANPDAGREPALSPLDVAAQRAIFLRLAVVAGVVIQGYLFVVPAVRLWAGFAAARPLRTAVATLAAVLALLAIRGIARALDAAAARAAPPGPSEVPLAAPAPGPAPGPATNPGPDPAGAAPTAAPPDPAPAAPAAGDGGPRGAGGPWRRLWPPLAVAYVAYAWVVAVTRPALAERIVVGGTLLTALALALVLVALHLGGRASSVRAPLPPRLARGLPGLAPRADRIAGLASWALAGLLLAAAAVLVAVGWAGVDPGALWARPVLRGALWRVLTALLVAFGAAALWAGVASWIDARLGQGPDAPTGRSRTLLALFRNAFTVAVVVLAGMVALSQLGLDIAPLLAGAGVIGLAVGFGAQRLVQDIITGIFIQLENALDVGDVVGVAGVTGGVEHVTIRSVRLRTIDGASHIIPFSSVTTVTNLTRDFAFHVAELQVGYGQDVDGVKAALRDAFDRLVADPAMAADVLEPLEPPVVVGLRETAMLVRTRIKTRPGRQWDVGNRYSETLKAVLDERGVEIPVASRTILLPAGGTA